MAAKRYAAAGFVPNPARCLTLTTEQLRAARTVAEGWQTANAAAGVASQKIDDNATDLEVAYLGAMGEGGFALLCGPQWFERWRGMAVAKKPRSQLPDVAAFRIRTRPWGGELLVKPGDRTDVPYVLMWAAPDTGRIAYCGWLFGFEVAQERYMNKRLPRPAFARRAETLAGWESMWAWYRSRSAEAKQTKGDA